MGYVIAAILVVLIVGGFVLFLVTSAARKSNVSDAGDPGAEQNALSILGSDSETPVGDTSQHADAPRFPPERDRDGAAVSRPVVGGEAEGERSTR
ncbi:MAG TPA: hypothetical protein VNS09_23135 [Solirubrobacter sp.]|nr:hypothetical protein [Solirubrobacter sp.]